MSSLLRLRSLLPALLLLASFPATSFAQSAAVPLRIHVTGFPDKSDKALLKRAIESLRAELVDRGGVQSETPDWTFFVGVVAIDEERAALSVSTLYRLPEEAVRVGAEAEVFYANLSEQDQASLPASGEWVREHVSRDFLRQYGHVQDQELLVTSLAGLESSVEEVVGRFLARHTRP